VGELEEGGGGERQELGEAVLDVALHLGAHVIEQAAGEDVDGARDTVGIVAVCLQLRYVLGRVVPVTL